MDGLTNPVIFLKIAAMTVIFLINGTMTAIFLCVRTGRDFLLTVYVIRFFWDFRVGNLVIFGQIWLNFAFNHFLVETVSQFCRLQLEKLI